MKQIRQLATIVLMCVGLTGFSALTSHPTAVHATTPSSGPLLGWGNNAYGDVGNGTVGSDPACSCAPSWGKALFPPGVTVTQVASGGDISFAIGSDGSLYGWGYDDHGQLAQPPNTYESVPQVIPLPAGITPKNIAADAFNVVMIGSDGNLYSWGYNGSDGVGDGTSGGEVNAPELIYLNPGDHNVKPTAIAAGGSHSLAIGSDGNLYSWGDNIYGQLGDGTTNDSDVPEVITLASSVKPTAIAAGSDHSMAIGSDGKLYTWGFNYGGALGDGTTVTTGCYCEPTPEVITLASSVTPTAIAAGGDHSMAIGSDGNLYTWGDNYDGEQGDGTTVTTGCACVDAPEQITLASSVTPVTIAAGSEHSMAIGSDGTLYAWGYNDDGQLGDGTTVSTGCECVDAPEAVTLPGSPAPRPSALAGGLEYSLALATDGQLFSTGRNAAGQLGTGPNGACFCQATPTGTTLPGNLTASSVAAGGDHNMAIGSDGNLYAWGYNYDGELGDGTTVTTGCYCVDAPERITLASGVAPTAIAAGGYHSMAIGSDGNLYTWGLNDNGQLGDGTTATTGCDCVDAPEQITLASGVTPVAIAAGDTHSLAIGSDGNLYAWGLNDSGQLGDGTTVSTGCDCVDAAEQISLGGATPTAISAGDGFSLVLTADGTVYAFGSNADGEIGNGSTSASVPTPTALSFGSGVTITAIVAGGHHALALASDGTLYAWGYNGYGQLGDGDFSNNSCGCEDSPAAVQFPASVTATAISADDESSTAIGSDDKFYSWGEGFYGETGEASTANLNLPHVIDLGAPPLALEGDCCSVTTFVITTSPPTASLISGFQTRWSGHRLTASWRVASNRGVLGFALSSGGRTVTHGTIPVHADSRYQVQVKAARRGAVRLTVLESTGQRLTVTAPGSG